MNSEILEKNLEAELYPQIDASGIDSTGLNRYKQMISSGVRNVPAYFSRFRGLEGHASSLRNRLTNLVYRIRPQNEPRLGGYFDPVTERIVYNPEVLRYDTDFAEDSVVHEKVHLFQKITGAIDTYRNVLSEHYRKIYRGFGDMLERMYGIRNARRDMENVGEVVGINKANAIIEGSATDAASEIRGKESRAYVPFKYAARAARNVLGFSKVFNPRRKEDVLAVDRLFEYNLQLQPAYALA